MERDYFKAEGSIVVRVPSPEYSLLLKLYNSGGKREGLLTEFGFSGSVMVVGLAMEEMNGQIEATFNLLMKAKRHFISIKLKEIE